MKQNYLKSLLLMLMMCVGMSAWADTVTFSYGDYTGNGTSSSGSSYTMDDKSYVSIGDTKFFGNTNYAHFYANSTITVTPKNGATITKLAITTTGTSYNGFQSSGKYTVSTGKVAKNSSNNAIVEWTGSATSSFTIGHDKQIRWTKIEVTYTTSGGGSGDSGDTPTNVAPSITTHPVSASYEQNVSAKALSVVATGTPTPEYKWYSNTTNSNENGTVIEDATNASYTPSTTALGTTYYYCIVTNSEGSAKSDVASITVTEPQPAALPFAFDGGKSDIASTQGISQDDLGTDYGSSPKLKFDSTNDYVLINFAEAAKKVTYTIKGNSTSGTYAFDVMESANGVDYTTVHSHTSITDATSYTDNLKSDSRYLKFVYTKKDAGNVALGNISIIAATVEEEAGLAFAQSTYTWFSNRAMQVSASSSNGSTGAITYALTEGDADAFLIDENTGEIVCETAGTYTVTATIAAVAGYKSGTAICTVTVLDPLVGNSIIVAEAGGKIYAMTTTNISTYFEYTQIKKHGDKYVVSNLDDILFYTSTTDGKTTIQNISDAKYVKVNQEKSISYSTTEYKWTNNDGTLIAATASHGTLRYNTGSPRFTTYTTTTGQVAKLVDLSDVVVGDVVTLADACTDGEKVYGTYSNSSAWVVPDNLTVSEISIVDGALYVENYKTSDVVPANTGVMVSAAEGGNYIVKYESDPETLALAESVLGNDNALHPSSEAMTGENLFYRLTMHKGTQIGFAWGAEDGAAFSLAANKAYLAVPKSNSVKSLVWFGSQEDAINAVETAAPKAIYDLQGRKVAGTQKGLYIINGKKVIK